MQIDNYGSVILNEQECIDALYSGKLTDLSNVSVDELTANQFNVSKNTNNDSFDTIKSYIQQTIDLKDFDKNNQNNWLMPKNYCPNLIDTLYEKCTTDIQKNRVSEELELFVKHGMIDVLYYLKYLVDTMRENNIIWGVGRGSSVASYVLFLIGVHKIDSLKYDLDIKEFLN